MDIKTMQKIVDDAPEGCDAYETDTHVFDLDGLRDAISDHNRTDYVTDIRNHISPMTIVQGD